MTLYEILEQIEELMESSVDENGVIDFETVGDALDNLELQKKEKIDNCIKFYKNRKAMAEALKNEKMAIAKRQQVAENEAEWMKEYLGRCLDGEKWETVAGKISYRKTESVQIDDIMKIPEKFRKPVKIEVDKNMIKKAIKNKEEVEGAWLDRKESVIIK